MKQDIKQNWFFNQPAQQVWDYLTKPELLEQWLMKNDFKPIVGHKFQFSGCAVKGSNKPGATYCEVLEIIPQKLLSYSWKSSSGLTMDSVVTWTLVEKNGGTELQLQHNGFTVLEEFTSHTDGWNTLINRLTQIFSTTHAINTNI